MKRIPLQDMKQTETRCQNLLSQQPITCRRSAVVMGVHIEGVKVEK
jgi:DNA-binding CsgD family transcriptional regulator